MNCCDWMSSAGNLAEVEALKAQRNRVAKEIGALMGQKKTTRKPKPRSRKHVTSVTELRRDKQAAEAETRARSVDASVAEPSARIGPHRARARRTIPSFECTARSQPFHLNQNRMWNYARSWVWSILSGQQKLAAVAFCFIRMGARKLERALIQFLLDLHTTEHGYTEVSPPFVVGPAMPGRRGPVSEIQGSVLRSR